MFRLDIIQLLNLKEKCSLTYKIEHQETVFIVGTENEVYAV